MSVKSIDQFYKHLLSNDDAKAEFQQLKNNYTNETLTPENALEFLEKGLIPFAQKLGYYFSVDDLIDYEAKNHTKQLRDEQKKLSNATLENITGGLTTGYLNTLACAKIILNYF